MAEQDSNVVSVTTSGTVENDPYSVLNDASDILYQVVNVNQNNILHEPTCIICSCPHREDVEKKWLENKSYEETKKTFKSRSTLNISNDIIDNHMRFHYERGVKEQQKLEYIGRVKRLNTAELTTLDRIRMGLSMLTERIMGINSIVPTNDMSVAEVEAMKSSETSRLMGSFNQLLKLQASIMGEMKNNGELIIIPRQDFVEVFNRAITEANNEEEKKGIQKVLKSLAELNRKTQ